MPQQSLANGPSVEIFRKQAGRPEDQGFDYFYGYLNTVHAHNYYPTYLWRNRKKIPLGNVVQEVPPGYAGFVGGMATEKSSLQSRPVYRRNRSSGLRRINRGHSFCFSRPQSHMPIPRPASSRAMARKSPSWAAMPTRIGPRKTRGRRP